MRAVARPKSDLPQRIVHAARSRFLHDGVDGASLRGIAQDAGTNIGMVYYYYPTKDDLFLAVVEDVYGALLTQLVQVLSSELPPEQRLRGLYARAAALDARELDVVRLVVREALVSSERLARVAARVQRGHLPLVLRTLVEGMASGRFEPSLHPIAATGATITLAIIPQLLHHVVAAAGLDIAKQLPSRAEVAELSFTTLLFGVAGPALRRPPSAAAKASRTLRGKRRAAT